MRMNTRRALRQVLVCLVATASACPGGEAPTPVAGRKAAAKAPDPKALFHKPVALVDAKGEVIVTRRAVGHPVVLDFNGDGLNDVLLGCHRGMDTARAEILVLINVGAKAAPRFTWPAAQTVRLEEKQEGFSVSCGCKSGGTFEVFPADYNGDGYFDLVVNTYWKTDGVRVLLNTGKSRSKPEFVRGKMLHRIGSHGKRSGGGDWDGDGVMDFVFPVNRYGWGVHRGLRGPGVTLRFADTPAMTHSDYRMVGQDGWFEHSPYAWNFSGLSGRDSGRTEIIASVADAGNKRKAYADHLNHVELYVLDRKARTVTRVGRVATINAALMRMSIGDLNGDGSMDVLCTGGVFSRGDETKIWVLYGKTPNIPAKGAKPPATSGGGADSKKTAPAPKV